MCCPKGLGGLQTPVQAFKDISMSSLLKEVRNHMTNYHKLIITVALVSAGLLLAIAVTQPNGALISTCNVTTEC